MLMDINETELDKLYVEGYREIPEDTIIGETGLILLAGMFLDDKWEELDKKA
jgi:hypothetical protein